LSSFRDPALIQRALDLTRSPDLRSQDTSLYLSQFFSGAATRDPAWAFTKAHWAELEPKITISLGDVTLATSLSSFCSAEARDDITAFFRAHKLPAAERTLQQTVERINNCIETKQRQQPALAAWLSAQPAR